MQTIAEIAMNTEFRNILINVYLDWRNNYLTVEKFAEHNGLFDNEAQTLIDLSRTVFYHQHPEA
jgi:hypothetical protein